MNTSWEIFRLTSKKALSLGVLGDRLKLSQKDLNAGIKRAKAEGYPVRVVSGFVSSRFPYNGESEPCVAVGGNKPGRYHVALVTDLHVGSRHFQQEALQDFFSTARAKGCVSGVCTGDILDGNKDVLLHDQTEIGWELQAKKCVQTFKKSAINWVAIDGNHDGYFSSSSGFISGRLLGAEMSREGISWQFAGVCLGRAVVHGARWHLWHPHGGASTRNAVRRILNDRIEHSMEPVDILAIGHFHKYVSVAAYPERVYGIAGGTFQTKASEFANRLASVWDVGGSIVSYSLGQNGDIEEVSSEFYPLV